MSKVTIAGNILIRAVELDDKKQYTESLVCYQEGLQLLVESLKGNLQILFTLHISLIILFQKRKMKVNEST